MRLRSISICWQLGVASIDGVNVTICGGDRSQSQFYAAVSNSSCEPRAACTFSVSGRCYFFKCGAGDIRALAAATGARVLVPKMQIRRRVRRKRLSINWWLAPRRKRTKENYTRKLSNATERERCLSAPH